VAKRMSGNRHRFKNNLIIERSFAPLLMFINVHNKKSQAW
jgi:hypothetical protein